MSNKDTSFADFVRQCWPCDQGYEWHLDAVCDYLELVAAGKAPRFIINVPPSHSMPRPPPPPRDDD